MSNGLTDWLKGVGGTIAASALAASVVLYAQQYHTSQTIESQVKATEELSKAVVELRVTVATMGEKFVTKDQLALEIKELRADMRTK